jgi:hypothetical protein
VCRATAASAAIFERILPASSGRTTAAGYNTTRTKDREWRSQNETKEEGGNGVLSFFEKADKRPGYQKLAGWQRKAEWKKQQSAGTRIEGPMGVGFMAQADDEIHDTGTLPTYTGTT